MAIGIGGRLVKKCMAAGKVLIGILCCVLGLGSRLPSEDIATRFRSTCTKNSKRVWFIGFIIHA